MSFNPKPKAMARSGMDGPHIAPAIAFGFGLNEIMHWQNRGVAQLAIPVILINVDTDRPHGI